MSGSSLHENVRIVGCRHTADRACTRVSALRISAPMSWYSCLYTAVKNNARKRAIFSCYGKGAENCTSVRPSARPSVRPLVTSSIVQRNDPNYARNRRVSIGDESTNQILKYLITYFLVYFFKALNNNPFGLRNT